MAVKPAVLTMSLAAAVVKTNRPVRVKANQNDTKRSKTSTTGSVINPRSRTQIPSVTRLILSSGVVGRDIKIVLPFRTGETANAARKTTAKYDLRKIIEIVV